MEAKKLDIKITKLLLNEFCIIPDLFRLEWEIFSHSSGSWCILSDCGRIRPMAEAFCRKTFLLVMYCAQGGNVPKRKGKRGGATKRAVPEQMGKRWAYTLVGYISMGELIKAEQAWSKSHLFQEIWVLHLADGKSLSIIFWGISCVLFGQRPSNSLRSSWSLQFFSHRSVFSSSVPPSIWLIMASQ